jgi:CRP/FNR family transcriptional regulator
VVVETTVEAILPLSPAGAEQLRAGLQTVSFDAPSAIIHKGQRVSGAYLVTRGQLRVFTYTPQGGEATLYFIHPGETCVLAINCLFNDLRYPAWVESYADTEVGVIPGPLYRQLFSREAAVQEMTVKALSSLVFRLMGELEQLHALNLEQRLAHFILGNACDQGVLRITQQGLAGHLGTSREVIARLMQGLTARGLVATGRGTVTLLDAARLAALITPGCRD